MQHRQITDDEVLQVMNELGLDASCAVTFREVRHYLMYNVPKCCVLFNERYVLPNPGFDWDHSYKYYEKGGVRKEFGRMLLEHLDYKDWADEAKHKVSGSIWYTPCPHCVLTNTFAETPPGCPCCQDKDVYPDVA